MLDALHRMRTTLSLDDDVLAAAKVVARQPRQPIGSGISALVRQALTTPLPGSSTTPAGRSRNGLPLLPLRPDGGPVDLSLVNSLRDELAP
jgi:hypothetical protein